MQNLGLQTLILVKFISKIFKKIWAPVIFTVEKCSDLCWNSVRNLQRLSENSNFPFHFAYFLTHDTQDCFIQICTKNKMLASIAAESDYH